MAGQQRDSQTTRGPALHKYRVADDLRNFLMTSLSSTITPDFAILFVDNIAIF